MKKCLFFFLLIFLLSNGFAQNDSLRLKLSYEEVRDSTFPLNIRIDFTSMKTTPISFYDKPLYMLVCEVDDVGLLAEVLKGDCYTRITKSECHPIPGLKQKENNFKQLYPGDTATYRDYESLLNRDDVQKMRKGFTGNYRFRVYRYYTDNGQRRKIFSNWLYVNYP